MVLHILERDAERKECQIVRNGISWEAESGTRCCDQARHEQKRVTSWSLLLLVPCLAHADGLVRPVCLLCVCVFAGVSSAIWRSHVHSFPFLFMQHWNYIKVSKVLILCNSYITCMLHIISFLLSLKCNDTLLIDLLYCLHFWSIQSYARVLH
jgi:hypothetical protein